MCGCSYSIDSSSSPASTNREVTDHRVEAEVLPERPMWLAGKIAEARNIRSEGCHGLQPIGATSKRDGSPSEAEGMPPQSPNDLPYHCCRNT